MIAHSTTQQPHHDCSILIAGAGPVGLIVALELAHHGVSCVLIDRSPEPTRFPKMDITNGRSMELFRRLGLVERLRADGVPPEYSFDVLWALPDGGPPVGHWALPSVNDQQMTYANRNDGSMPLEADQRIPQYKFEAMGRELCRANPLIDFREGVAFAALEQDETGVTVTLNDSETGNAVTLRTAYLVGADGAGSRVRKALDIALDVIGTPPLTYMVHFRSADLATFHRHGTFWHYFSMGSALISQDEKEEWTFHCPLFSGPPATEPDPLEMIARSTGLRPRIDEVLLTSVWQPRFALADRYGAGRVFLAGDAVHQVFPVGGYGMNTGVGDAVDIGWKLAAVANGWAGPRLLESYEAERRPVGERNRAAAIRHLDVHIGFLDRTLAGLSRDQLKTYVEGRRGENELDGIEYGYRYMGSDVIMHEEGVPPRWSEWDYVPSTWPGARPPSFLLADGSVLFDRFGSELTLVDFVGDGTPLVAAAIQQGIPVKHLLIAEEKVHQAWERNYVLIRPDQHVAWRSNILPGQDAWQAILLHVCGWPASQVS